MAKYFVFLNFLLFILISCSSPQKPQITFDHNPINLGEIKCGNVENFSLLVSNRNKFDLEIKKISTSCGLMLISDSSFIITKGQAVNINFLYVADNPGKYEEVILIYSDAKPRFSFIDVIAEVSE
jgi:hypothetical protein